MSISTLTGLKLGCHNLVLISLLIVLRMLFMVMFASILSTVMQPNSSSHTTCLSLASLLCSMGVIISLFFPDHPLLSTLNSGVSLDVLHAIWVLFCAPPALFA